MAIIWRDQMTIDGAMVDNDHKCLIAIINDVEVIRSGTDLPKRVAAILRRLDAYARSHFEREEQLQSAVSFPHTNVQHDRHLALMCELDAMSAECEISRSPKDWVAFHKRLCNFLHHWLVDHIIKHDLLMRPFVDEMRKRSKGIAPLNEAVRLREAH